MDEIQKQEEGTEVAAYTRGIGIGAAMRGTLLRFLPASALSTALVHYAMNGFPPAGSILGMALSFVGFAGIMSLGYGLGLEGMRRWLYPDAGVDGRRSVIAGLMSPLAIYIMATLRLDVGMVGAMVIPAALTLGLAVLMFFSWLTPTPGMGAIEGPGEPRPLLDAP